MTRLLSQPTAPASGALGLMDRAAPQPPNGDQPQASPPEAAESAGQAVQDVDSVEIQDLLAAVRQDVARQRLPVATYRLQFTGDFTFRQAAELIDYLGALGVTDVYASPLLQARERSQSGYDVADCERLNEDLGTPEEFEALALGLREKGMGLVLDIVPNHMTMASTRNRWWLDVLENGRLSNYASFFDIDWAPLKPDLTHKILLPVLGDQYGKVLESGELKLQREAGALWIGYHTWQFPLSPSTYGTVLSDMLLPLEAEVGADHADVLELHSIVTAIRNLPSHSVVDRERIAEYHREKEFIKHRLRSLFERFPPALAALDRSLETLNGKQGDPRSFDRLDELIGQQPYRLAHWQVASDEINYRRFFDVNELAAICVENPEVFQQTHRLVFDLIERGLVTGLRIDHPDGLFDPRGYLRQLQETRLLQLARDAWQKRSRIRENSGDTAGVRTLTSSATDEQRWQSVTEALLSARQNEPHDSPLARPLYVAVEKILDFDEPLADDWAVHGTVGYEFLNRLNGLFVDPAGEQSISTTYARFTDESLNFRELTYRCKRLIVRMSMASELQVLGYKLDRISERNRWTRDFTLNSLTRALQEVAACFGVYRTYVTQEIVPEADLRVIEAAVARAKRHNRAMSASIFDFVRDALLLRYRDNADDEERQALWQFVGKFQQLTGPIMAKGVEDTAFYRFNRLVSLNEVGGDPARFGNDPAAFHRLNASRVSRQLRGLSSTSTHDTKRSEDVRARINVLSEIPRLWRQKLSKWSRLNRRLRSDVEGHPAPAPSDEYLLYQTLIGLWPDTPPHGAERKQRIERAQQYMLKVAREAKSHTSWISPHEPYERALTAFVTDILDDQRRRSFVADLQNFAQTVADHGRWNSLSQTLLKIASPGVPDFYQGCELWTHSLVDPDNRRPVDFENARRRLEELLTWMGADASPERRALLSNLVESRADGRIKLFVTLMGLRARRALPELFTEGEYIPLTVNGPQAEHLVAIARRRGAACAIALAPRLTVKLCGFGGPPPLGPLWEGAMLELPPDWPVAAMTNVYSGEKIELAGGLQNIARLLADFPVALLTG
jgi:(1->4)-alpha-D-glucan 1-alpha-D-glucosylmutase